MSPLHSSHSSVTHDSINEKEDIPEGDGESTLRLPTDKPEEAVGNLEDDWENDPDNARNWSFEKKWTAVGIVGALTFFLTCFQLKYNFYLLSHRCRSTHWLLHWPVQ